MEIKRKTLAIILVATIGLSLFVGLVSAPGTKDALTQILEVVLGIDTKVNIVDSKLDSIDSRLGSIEEKIDFSKEVLFTFSGDFDSKTWWSFTSDAPALFTVTVNAFNIPSGSSILLSSESEYYYGIIQFGEINGPVDTFSKVAKTFTLAADAVYLHPITSGGTDISVTFSIVVQGTPGTIITTA